MPPTNPTFSVLTERLTRALGEAVIRIWSNLPQEVQNHLFQEAVTSQGESIRSQLAVFLHGFHGARMMQELVISPAVPTANPKRLTAARTGAHDDLVLAVAIVCRLRRSPTSQFNAAVSLTLPLAIESSLARPEARRRRRLD